MGEATWYEVVAIPQMTLREFAEQHGLHLVVRERRVEAGSSIRYYAAFTGVEVMERGMLASTSGDGSTPEAAIADYTRRISLSHLAVDAMLPTRREIEVPRLASPPDPSR